MESGRLDGEDRPGEAAERASVPAGAVKLYGQETGLVILGTHFWS